MRVMVTVTVWVTVTVTETETVAVKMAVTVLTVNDGVFTCRGFVLIRQYHSLIKVALILYFNLV